MANNNTADVTSIKGIDGGYGFSAATTATAPTDFTTLGSGFDNMGFISSDGIEENMEADTEEITDMNGDVVFVAKSKETETIVITLISLTVASLSEIFGHSNVDASGTNIEIEHKSANHDSRIYVFDLVLKDGRKWRKVVPNGQVSEVGAITYASGSVFSRQITINCAPDSSGVRMYDYIQKSA